MEFDRKELELQALASLELIKRASAADPAYFITNCCYTFNPKRKPYHFKFELFPFQVGMVRQLSASILNGEDTFIEKAREMGATYTILDIFLWFWLFVPGSNFLIGSRVETDVDGTSGGAVVSNKEATLFGKLEYTLSHLNPYFLPKGFDIDKNKTYMSLVNPENGNVIMGAASSANFSRSGRQKAILMDEFAFWENDVAAWGSSADTTDCRIVLTTPGLRLNTKAKRLRFNDEGEKIKLITLPYYLDPRKTPEWLEKQRERRSAEDFAREIMINWEGSLQGIVYPEIRKAVVGQYPYEPTWMSYMSWDFGLDAFAIQYWQINPLTNRPRLIDCYTNSNKPTQFYYPFVGSKPFIVLGDGTRKYLRYQYTEEDLAAIEAFKQYKKPIHVGDPDVEKRSIGNFNLTSTQKALNLVGVHVHTNTLANSFYSRREQTKVWLQGGIEVNENPRTTYWLECMKSARYPRRSENSQATVGVLKPVHDATSHHRTATEYLFVNLRTDKRASAGAINVRHNGHNNEVKTFERNAQGEYVPPNPWKELKRTRGKKRTPFNVLPK